MTEKEWFETWFDTTYYHLLYRNRNEVEARQFLDALLRFLSPKSDARFIDIACGKGRHSTYLNQKGFDVTGIDLSENSIAQAQACQSDSQSIRFLQHDIRNPFPVDLFDIAVNLFTSFGYFDSDEEHLLALRNIHACLNPSGRFVLDYLNTTEVLTNLKRTDYKSVGNIEFEISRSIEDNAIVKSILVNDDGQSKQFEERVTAYSKDNLVGLLEGSGFLVTEIFGDYELNQYNSESPRVVIIAQKKP